MEYLERYKALVGRYRYKADACRALDIEPATLTKRLKGTRPIRKEHVLAIERALQVDARIIQAEAEAEAKVVSDSVIRALRMHREARPG